MAELSDSQRRIVTFDGLDRHMLVIAPPGSGKTFTIVERIRWLIDNGHADASHILALTFTNKAGRELQDRLARGSHAQVRAGTLHSWALDFLRAHCREANLPEHFQICDEARRLDMLRAAMSDRRIPLDEDASIKRVSRWIGLRRCNPDGEPVPPPSPLSLADMEAIESSYRAQLNGEDLLDFDDLLVYSADVLWSDAEARLSLHGRLRFVFIDEFHDLSAEQYRLLRAIAPERLSGRQVMVVADPNQAIYAFRGADAELLLTRYRADYRPVAFELVENFRSSPELVDAANGLIQAGGGHAASRPVQPSTSRPIVEEHVTDVDEALWIAKAIQTGVRKGRSYRDFAIVYRTHARANVLEDVLLGNDVPVMRVQPYRFYDDRLVVEGFRYLQLVAALDDRTFEPAVNWPRVLVDELTMMQLRTAARRTDLRLVDLATQPALIRSTITPLGADGIERFLGVLRTAMDGIHDARGAVERMLPLVRQRRDPIPAAEMENFRSTLYELSKAIDDVAATLFEVIAEQLPIRITFDETDPDQVLAASILSRTLDRGFLAQIQLGQGPDPAFRFDLRELGRPGGEFTRSALVYRLCQRLDELFDRSRRQRFVVFDLETTSTHLDTAQVLQIGAVVVDDGRVTDQRFASYARPSGPEAIPPEVTDLTGIRWSDVEDAPSSAEAIGSFLAFAGDAPLVGHNIDSFDLPLLRRVCADHGLPAPPRYSIDTMKVWRRLHPRERWGLDAALTPEERRSRSTHRADHDALLSARVFLRLMREIGQERRTTLLAEELPLVAASVAIQNRRDFDSQLLALVGRRAADLGQGILPSAAAAMLHLPGRLDAADAALQALERPPDSADAHWERIERQWLEVVEVYEQTHDDQSLQAFANWFQLAVHAGVEHDDADRVTMMTVHAAKGREWPIVIMLGAEDDQYVFPIEPDVEDARRHFYVGMTRARDLLIITHATHVNGRQRSGSRFLAELGSPSSTAPREATPSS